MNTRRIEILTKEIMRIFKNTGKGHCARVDFLGREESEAICQLFEQINQNIHIKAYILSNASNHNILSGDNFYISADYAIELRNRKEKTLCLFVPMDMVDATVSSLANSFAVIDGRTLYDGLLKQLRSRLSVQAQKIVQTVSQQLRGSMKASKEQLISFVDAILDYEEQGKLAQVGLELWRIGLIADARPAFSNEQSTFLDFLDNNKRCVRALTRPAKLQASLLERIQSLLTDEATGRQLTTYFRSRNLQDVRNWSQALIDLELTFDRWRFPDEDRSDIKGVTVQRFLNASGEVEKYSHLKQPNGVQTSLQVCCGQKSTVVLRWKTEPPHPHNLKYWRIEMFPSSEEPNQESMIDLPVSEISASRRNLSVKLDFALERSLGVYIRVTPIEVSGQASVHPETKEAVYGDSNEFFLMPETDGGGGVDPPIRETHREVPTLALGRLEQAMQTREDRLRETEPQWNSKELEYFSLRLDNKRVISIGLSAILKNIEERAIQDAYNGGMFQLLVDEIRPVSSDKCQARPLLYKKNDVWKAFWIARESFFKRLRQDERRHLIEVVVWNVELANAAIRYAQSYQELIQVLLQNGDTQADSLDELREAMSVDTLLVRVRDGSQQIEEALVTLPTHPLRVAWLVGYTQLLQRWEEQIFERAKPAIRKGAVELEALRLLSPTNVPAFAFHADSRESFVFFQNLRFFYGVHLPVGVPDPHRRYGELATILGADFDQISIGTIQPEQLANHLAKFLEMHSYNSTLVTTLVNPDRGDFFAEVLKQLLQVKNTSDEDESPQYLVEAFQITSYVEDERKSSVQALNQVRYDQLERLNNSGSSYFLPGLATTLRDIKQLEEEEFSDAHIAVVSDFTRPSLLPYAIADAQSEIKSFALYGLITRFVPFLKKDQQGLIWRYQIFVDRLKPSESHPVRALYSDVLLHLHETLLNADSRLLEGPEGTRPALEVRLEEPRRRLLERLHQASNWVVTLDRFFSLDYYDSPHIEGLEDVARKYVLDYSPEFSEGLGHRLMVTTSWHEEIGSLLRQAMEEQGFAAIDSSVSHLLHYLKTVSGSLALQALESTTSATAAVGLGVVTAWLQKKNRLKQSVLVPVDLHPRLFAKSSSGASQAGEKRCDLALFSLKRNIVEVTFIEVKWRRGRVSFENLGGDMYLQMQSSKRVLEDRFFNPDRIDGALQRSHLGNVLRVYFDRSCRYGLFDEKAKRTFLERLTELEKAGLEFRYSFEGYIVSLNDPSAPFSVKEAKIRVLTAADFDSETFPTLASSSSSQEMTSLLFDEYDNAEIFEQQDEIEDNALENKQNDLQTLYESNVVELSVAALDGEQQLFAAEQETPQYTQEMVIPLGVSLQGERVDWIPSVKGSPHLFVIGIPGQGKSWTTTRLLIELGEQGVPALVLDFHGQFADPNEPFAQKNEPRVIDVARGLPFSPFECSQNGDQSDIISNSLEVAEIFAHVTKLGAIQQDSFYEAILNAYQANGFGLSQGEKLLEYPTLNDVLFQIKKQDSSRNVATILARCRPLLEMNLFRPEKRDMDLLAKVKQGLVIDLHRVLETLQLAAGAFVLRKVYKDMFRWGPTDNLRLAIVLDEAHRLAKDVTLPKLMKEGRKFGIAVIVASQELTDFHQGIVGNVGTKIIFRVNHPESRKVAGLIQAPTGIDLPKQISQLKVGTSYVQTPEMQTALKVQMYPL